MLRLGGTEAFFLFDAQNNCQKGGMSDSFHTVVQIQKNGKLKKSARRLTCLFDAL
jgi:hypothetical protein